MNIIICSFTGCIFCSILSLYPCSFNTLRCRFDLLNTFAYINHSISLQMRSFQLHTSKPMFIVMEAIIVVMLIKIILLVQIGHENLMN